jgi:hypothetical protein
VNSAVRTAGLARRLCTFTVFQLLKMFCEDSYLNGETELLQHTIVQLLLKRSAITIYVVCFSVKVT